MRQNDETGLVLWTVYKHPSDYPNEFVARRFLNARPTPVRLVSPTLGALRGALMDMGLTAIARSPDDDPVIVETWL